MNAADIGRPRGLATVEGGARPSEAQRRYLERGLSEPGGKLPLFDRQGREISHKTIETCLAHGWAEPWFLNPIKPEWLVCKLTPAGYRALGRDPPAAATQQPPGDKASSPDRRTR